MSKASASSTTESSVRPPKVSSVALVIDVENEFEKWRLDLENFFSQNGKNLTFAVFNRPADASLYLANLINPASQDRPTPFVVVGISKDPFLLHPFFDQPSLQSFFQADVRKRNSLGMIKILLSEHRTTSSIKEAVNRLQAFRLLNWPVDVDSLRESLETAFDYFQEESQRLVLTKEWDRQNKELESLNTGLEKIVEERTYNIKILKEEEESRLRNIRGFYNFVKTVSLIDNLEDFLMITKKSLRPFSRLGEPYLIVQKKNSSEAKIYYFESNQENLKTISFTPLAAESRLAVYLANAIGRPFLKVVHFPLQVQEGQAVLVFESNLNEPETAILNEWMNERVKPLTIALDRLLIEQEMNEVSFRWEQTFDAFRDPTAIINQKGQVIRSNRPFELSNIKDWQNTTVMADQKIYEIHKYRFMQDMQFIQFKDVTQSRELMSRVHQTEKLSAVGRLAGNIAHELNNPLSGLRSLAQWLITQADEQASLRSDLVEIEKAALRCQKIIKNLMDFSRGHFSEKRDTSLNEVVEMTMPFVKSLLRTHSYQLHLDADQKIYSSPYLLSQVLFNLINNACQAMKEKGSLEISSAYNEKTRSFELSVSDSGPGIAEDLHERIFEPFFTTKPQGQGTGLGLSLSRQIIRSLGGDLVLESTLGKGSQFKILFTQDALIENSHRG